MKSSGILVLALCTVLCAWSPALAQHQVMGVQAALCVPTSDLGEIYDLGFGAQGQYLINATGTLYTGFSIGYKYFSLQDGDGSLSTIPLMATLRYNFGTGEGMTPYLGAELGAHIWSTSTETVLGTVDLNGSDFGYAPVLGVYVPAGSMQVDLQLRYDVMVWEGSDGTWFGLNMGVLFTL